MENWQDWLWLQFLFLRYDIVRFLRRIGLKRPGIGKTQLSASLGVVGPAGTGKTLTINIPEALCEAQIWFFDEADEEPEVLDPINPDLLEETPLEVNQDGQKE